MTALASPVTGPVYAELQVATNFTFLRGASHAEELALSAAALGHAAIAVTDRNSLAGVVRAHVAAKSAGIRLVVGCRLDLSDGPSLLCLPTDRRAYGRLSRLLTMGRRRAPKGQCELTRADLYEHDEGQILIAVPPEHPDEDFITALRDTVRDSANGCIWPRAICTGATMRGGWRGWRPWPPSPACRWSRPTTSIYHAPRPPGAAGRADLRPRPLHDPRGGLPALRQRRAAPEAAGGDGAGCSPLSRRGRPHGWRSPHAAPSRWTSCATNTRTRSPPRRTPQQDLADLTWRGCGRGAIRRAFRTRSQADRGGAGADRRSCSYAPYFLTVHDIVRFAAAEGILCQGRGSAANSAVCYCLGVTAVDPTRIDLLFERFVSAARNEPPDIDVDFEHERREEVIQYIYEKYGRDRAA